MMYNAKNLTICLHDDSMECVSFGTGEKPLVLIPGLGDGMSTVKGMAKPFALLYRYLAKRYKVYMFSFRNHLSSMNPENVTTRNMASDLAEALDKLMVEHGAFKSTYFGQINKMLLDLGYFSRGILENRIEKLKGNMENLTDEYQVLQILDKSILQCMEIVDSYIGVIQIKDLQNSWEQQKKYLEGNYLGIYSVGTTKEFVERNS